MFSGLMQDYKVKYQKFTASTLHTAGQEGPYSTDTLNITGEIKKKLVNCNLTLTCLQSSEFFDKVD